MLADALSRRGIEPVITREPGGTPLGVALRSAFLETKESVAPMAELLAFAADRAQHVEKLILPNLAAGRLVISDRYADATFAYQGAGRGFPIEKVRAVIDLATGGLKPDLTLFFDIEVDEALNRMSERDESTAKRNRMDEETAEFYSRVREAYLSISISEPERLRIINASGSVSAIHQRVLEVMDPFLQRCSTV